jgi:hypothetical protein
MEELKPMCRYTTRSSKFIRDYILVDEKFRDAADGAIA